MFAYIYIWETRKAIVWKGQQRELDPLEVKL